MASDQTARALTANAERKVCPRSGMYLCLDTLRAGRRSLELERAESSGIWISNVTLPESGLSIGFLRRPDRMISEEGSQIGSLAKTAARTAGLLEPLQNQTPFIRNSRAKANART